jgi:hypothetical protein
LDQAGTRSKTTFCRPAKESELIRGLVILGGVLLCGIPTLWWAWVHSGNTGLWAAGAAAGLCLLGAWLALPCTAWIQDPQRMLIGLFLGMGIRSGVPLGLGFCLYLLEPPLAKAGFLYYLVIFYLPLLILETYMSLPKRPKSFTRDEQSR